MKERSGNLFPDGVGVFCFRVQPERGFVFFSPALSAPECHDAAVWPDATVSVSIHHPDVSFALMRVSLLYLFGHNINERRLVEAGRHRER